MGFIGVDKSGEDNEHWVTVAPTATEEAHDDVTTTYDVTCGADGIARISSGKGD